jgi:shikimate kinase
MGTTFLIGYMGSGKTTYGRLIAKELKMKFVDLDSVIEEKYSLNVTSLFEKMGEDGFRKIERDTLHEIAQLKDTLIATGGGTPCFFDNMEFMNKMGDTIYLRTSVRELRDRLKMSRTKRPLLSHKSDQELESHIAMMLEMRELYYMKAKFILDTDDLNPNNLLSSYQAIHEV